MHCSLASKESITFIGVLPFGNGNSWPCATLGFTSSTFPFSFTPCAEKIFLAGSMPTVIMLIIFPFLVVETAQRRYY